MNIILISSGFILAFIIVFCYECKIRRTEPMNKVHFYVARDKIDYKLWLYIGKPVRSKQMFKGSSCSSVIVGEYHFSNYGLDVNDYANLKWDDEPVEVFINMED